MSKLLILQGLPASGKTTRAKEILAQCGNGVRINRDLLRTMLHFDVWSGPKEGVTRHAARLLARSLLTEGKVGLIVIDDTNLHPGILASWKQLAHDTESQYAVVRMDTSLETCLLRDAKREKAVGRHVIVGMALQYQLYPPPKKGFVLCDLDGTLADLTHRRHYVQQEPKDWAGFFAAMGEDTLRADVARQVRDYWEEGYEILYVSGRPDTYRAMTETWLQQQGMPYYTTLFMRRGTDKRPDSLVKEEILRTYFPEPSWIHAVIDDRPSVIRMWQQCGLHVIDVGTGIEF